MAKQHCNGGRRRSRYLRPVEPEPRPSRDEIVDACMHIADEARGAAVRLGIHSDHGRWLEGLIARLEREAEAVANLEEE
jgi:hypothetical protein